MGKKGKVLSVLCRLSMGNKCDLYILKIICCSFFDYDIQAVCAHLFFFSQARYFFQQLISGVSYCHAMVMKFFSFQLSEVFLYQSCSHISFPYCHSKYATEI